MELVNSTIKKGCFPITVVLIILLFIVWNKCSYSNFKSLEFSGKITSISYDDKSDPSVIINSKIYRLTFGRKELRVGDSLAKRKNSFIVRQFRKGKLLQKYVWGE